MLERAPTRALPIINKGVELTPAAQACCGVCRTCVTANILTLAMAGVTGAAVYVLAGIRRVFSAKTV